MRNRISGAKILNWRTARAAFFLTEKTGAEGEPSAVTGDLPQPPANRPFCALLQDRPCEPYAIQFRSTIR
jgi:hypothetical protein